MWPKLNIKIHIAMYTQNKRLYSAFVWFTLHLIYLWFIHIYMWSWFYFFQKIHKNILLLYVLKFCTVMTSFGVITLIAFPLRLNQCHSKLYHELQYFVSVIVFQRFLYHSFSIFKRCSVCADEKPSNSKNYSQALHSTNWPQNLFNVMNFVRIFSVMQNSSYWALMDSLMHLLIDSLHMTKWFVNCEVFYIVIAI